MIEYLKDDTIVHRVGGRFKFTALVQMRIRQLMSGERPLVERNGMSDLEVAIKEIAEGKLGYSIDPSVLPPDMRPRTRKIQGGDEDTDTPVRVEVRP